MFSYQVSSDFFRFFDLNTELVEVEVGIAVNDSPNIAVRRAIELAVVDLVEAGFDLALWKPQVSTANNT